MPDDYEVTLSDGRTVTLRGNRPPTPDEAKAAISKMTPEQLAGITTQAEGLRSSSEAPTSAPPLTEFMQNAKRSGAAQFTNLINAGLHPIDTVGNLLNVAAGGVEKIGRQRFGAPVGEHEKYADAAGEYFKNRFGGVENIKKTAYEDPFGLLADVAGVAALGGGAVAQGAGRAAQLADVTGATRTASALGDVSSVAGKVAQAGDWMNPVAIPTKLSAAALKEAALVPIAYANYPSKALRDKYGARNILKEIRDQGLVTKGMAERNIQSAQAAKQAGLQTPGAPPFTTADVEAAIRRDVAPVIANRVKAGGVDDTQVMEDAIARFHAAHPTGQLDLAPAEPVKAAAQDLAYESGRKTETVNKLTQQAIARALKTKMEQSAGTVGTDLGGLNLKVKAAVGAKKAMEGASPLQLHRYLTAAPIVSGQLFHAQDPLSFALAAGETAASLVPAIPRAAGVGLNIAAKGIDPYLARLALMRQLSGQDDDTQQSPPNQ